LLIQRRRNRLAENLLRESEERMTFTAASANIGLWQFDQKTDELWATEHCRSLFGLASDVPLTRTTFMTAIHPDDHEIAIALLRAIPNADRSAVTDVRVVPSNNQARWIRILARSRPDNRDAPNQSSGIFVDITEQKTAEGEATLHRQKVAHLKRAGERAARLMSMHAMSASIAHEISQPLGAMVANSDAALLWLAETPPNVNKARTSVERVASDGHRASGVIASLRGLYRKDASEKAPLDVNKLIGEVLAIEREELQNNRISVKLDLAGVIALVFADRLQLQQVILNLIVNAVGAMSSVTDRPRELRVTSAVHESGDVLISIEDSGTGVDREKMDTIFEPFFTTKSSGMGLGLWICRTIIESHNGRLTASPGIDHGSVFQVALPGGNAAANEQEALESFC
jgi:C4-dicarboxylate-specific signal transduction histidine kinase